MKKAENDLKINPKLHIFFTHVLSFSEIPFTASFYFIDYGN